MKKGKQRYSGVAVLVAAILLWGASASAQQALKFDPLTGEPIAGSPDSAAVQVNQSQPEFDPLTGEEIRNPKKT